MKAVKGIGVEWVRQIDRTYDVTKVRDTLREALTTKEKGPKVIVASSECMLNKQRRVKPLFSKAVKEGKRRVAQRFGVDEDICLRMARLELADPADKPGRRERRGRIDHQEAATVPLAHRARHLPAIGGCPRCLWRP